MAWPTSSNPKVTFVTCRFPADEAGDLETAASAAGMSKSAYLRDCVRRVIAADRKKAARLKGGSDG